MHYQVNSLGALPISLSTAKSFLKISVPSDDAIISKIIDAVVSFAEEHTGYELRLGNQWLLGHCQFEDLELRRYPVERIDGILYFDTNGVSQALDPSVYQIRRGKFYDELTLADGQSWPTDVATREDAILVVFTTQPQTHSSHILELSMLRHIADMYENRGDDELFSNVARGKKFYIDYRRPLI